VDVLPLNNELIPQSHDVLFIQPLSLRQAEELNEEDKVRVNFELPACRLPAHVVVNNLATWQQQAVEI